VQNEANARTGRFYIFQTMNSILLLSLTLWTHSQPLDHDQEVNPSAVVTLFWRPYTDETVYDGSLPSQFPVGGRKDDESTRNQDPAFAINADNGHDCAAMATGASLYSASYFALPFSVQATSADVGHRAAERDVCDMFPCLD
jgi:hypothetical protein